jgi:hypothetical protein
LSTAACDADLDLVLQEGSSVDDTILAAQYAQTGDLMDLCFNDAWLREAVAIEDRVNGQVEAGLGMQEYSRAVNALTSDQSQQLRQQVRVQSILFTSLRQWMETWDLGAGFDATYAIARQLIRAHLVHLTLSQEACIETFLADETQTDSTGNERQEKLVAMLSEMFTQEDWQVMAKAASQSISSRVLSAGQAKSETAA